MFATLIVPVVERQAINWLNLQFSFEDDQVGLDWVVLGPINKMDRQKIEKYFYDKGFDYQIRFTNDVKYLRVTSGDLILLCEGVLRDLYHINDLQKFGVVSNEFKF